MSSIFPIINHIDDLRSAVEHKSEIRFSELTNGTTVVCYVVSDKETFNERLARECRGITFDTQSGLILQRPLHKFFNVGEREETLFYNIDWASITRVMDKRDGSMITVGALPSGNLGFKTKKTFDSDVAKMANEYLKRPNDLNRKYIDFSVELVEKGLTPIYEFTTPRMRIVLPYTKERLTLLHVRDNVTGIYLDFEESELADLIGRYEIPVVDRISDFNPSSMMESLKTLENKEGFVCQTDNGEMYKAKTTWYLRLHHVVTFIRERDVAEMVVEEKVDDAKSALTEIGVSLAKVEEIEHRVLTDLLELERKTDAAVQEFMDPFTGEKCGQISREAKKAIVMSHREHPYFHLAMTKINYGRDPDYKDYFYRNIWKQNYSLDQLCDIQNHDEE